MRQKYVIGGAQIRRGTISHLKKGQYIPKNGCYVAQISQREKEPFSKRLKKQFSKKAVFSKKLRGHPPLVDPIFNVQEKDTIH